MSLLRGPRGDILYERDALGYPSVEARDLIDATWARGWFHAVDRLVQIQLSLAVARGRAQALLGPVVLARHTDRMTRVHRFTDDLDRQTALLSPEMRALVDAYCSGFNAGVKKRGWPLILRAVGIKPAKYRPSDLVLLYRIVSWFGLTSLAELPPLIVGELAAGGVPARALELLLGDAASADEIANMPAAVWPPELALFSGSPAGGSNAIAIAGSRSSTGGALLLGDPHMEIARIPPVLYAMHASFGSGDYLQGLGIPGLAWPSFGRTSRVAWSYTYGHAPCVDVCVVRCRRGEHFDGTAFVPMTRRASNVVIKGRPSETWTFWDCDFGTVVGDAHLAKETALPCVRWSGVRETYKDFNGVCALLHAQNLDDAIAANRAISTLSLDAVLADADGRIGRVHTGRIDRRPETSGGVVPRAPGGAREPAAESARPQTADPATGFIVSANVRPDETKGAAWVPMPEPRARYERLRQLVAGASEPIRPADLVRFICDACDANATRLLPVWAPHLPEHPRAQSLVAWATDQPGTGDDHFAHLTLWSCLHGEVCRSLLGSVIGSTQAARLLDDLAALIAFQHHLDAALALERPAHVDETLLRKLLTEAFPRALDRASTEQAKLPRRDRFRNVLFGGKLELFGFDSKPVENLGGPTTPNQVTAVSFGDQRLVFGAAGRFLCDMSQPGSWYCLSGGASERRFGPGYAAGLDAWARGEFVALGDAPPFSSSVTPRR
jgi:penicillin amidase